jgi:hypothetical protein
LKKLLVIVLILDVLVAGAQAKEDRLTTVLRNFHLELVNGNITSISRHTDVQLSYGHSNGWVESRAEMIKNLETGYLNYNSFTEDSLQVVISGNRAHARFVADINVTMNGKEGRFHLKVLEVWVRKGKRWLLFARQAVKG